ncbi:hypothetical protein [Alkalinema sp. FACHB-956]|uniref:hypothetical protein n=1 Tax=Alkalinema sp. FACHB-956 TaxID=2692768 RepID=UPI001688B879|nr:hypothetical protein [Alkalinema sp. FACHB-956]MBD2329403.1 hypothetical protein [Alkalinema sp. FACHB-956]
MSDVRAVAGNPSEVWDDLSWDDLNRAEQQLWGNLGWDADSWEEETDPPASSEKYWEELSGSERQSAEALGYTQETWDEEDEE